MLILLKNKHTLQLDDFYFKSSIGKKGTSKKKIEGDYKTPVGTFSIEHLYYRKDRIIKPKTKLKCIPIIFRFKEDKFLSANLVHIHIRIRFYVAYIHIRLLRDTQKRVRRRTVFDYEYFP